MNYNKIIHIKGCGPYVPPKFDAFVFLSLKLSQVHFIFGAPFYDYHLSLFSHRISTSVFDNINLYIISHFLVVSLVN